MWSAARVERWEQRVIWNGVTDWQQRNSLDCLSSISVRVMERTIMKDDMGLSRYLLVFVAGGAYLWNSLCFMLNMITFGTCESGCGQHWNCPCQGLQWPFKPWEGQIFPLSNPGLQCWPQHTDSRATGKKKLAWSWRPVAIHFNSAAHFSWLSIFFSSGFKLLLFFKTFYSFCCSSFALHVKPSKLLTLTCAGQRSPPVLPADEPLKRSLSSAAPQWM